MITTTICFTLGILFILVFILALQKSMADQLRQSRIDEFALLQSFVSRYIDTVQQLLHYQMQAAHMQDDTSLDLDDDEEEVDEE